MMRLCLGGGDDVTRELGEDGGAERDGEDSRRLKSFMSSLLFPGGSSQVLFWTMQADYAGGLCTAAAERTRTVAGCLTEQSRSEVVSEVVSVDGGLACLCRLKKVSESIKRR